MVRVGEAREAIMAFLGKQGFTHPEVIMLTAQLLTDLVCDAQTDPTVESVAQQVESIAQQWVVTLRTPGYFRIGSHANKAAAH